MWWRYPCYKEENSSHRIQSESTVKNFKVACLQGPPREGEWGGQKKRYKMMMKGCWEGHPSDQSYVWILRHCIFILHRSSLFARLLLSLSHSQFHHGMHFSLSLSLSLSPFLLLEALTNARRCLTAWPDRCNPPTPCPHVGNNPYKSQWLPEVWRFLNTHSTYTEVSWCNCTVFSDSGLFLLLLVVGCRDFLLVVWYAHCYWVTE
jgi:hypothetical protein